MNRESKDLNDIERLLSGIRPRSDGLRRCHALRRRPGRR